MFKRTNKLEMVDLALAQKVNAMAKSGTLVGTGSALGVLDGQVGLMSADFQGTVGYGGFLTGGETTTDVRAVQLIQGTPASGNTHTADPWEVGDKAYINSGTLFKDQIRSASAIVPKIEQYGADFLSDIVTPEDLTEYGLFVELKSRRIMREFGLNGNRVPASYLTPDYTALGTVDPKDHMLQNLLAKLNTASTQFTDVNGKATGREPFVAFGVKVGAGSGTVIGDIVVGDVVPFMTNNGVVSNVTVTRGMLAGLAQAIVDSAAGSATQKLLATSTIEVIDAENAGGAATIDAFVVMGLEDSVQSGLDTQPTKMVRVKTNLKFGFRVTDGFSGTHSNAKEAVNKGRVWDIVASDRYQRTVHSLYTTKDYLAHNMSEGANYVDVNKDYASVVIDYYDFEDTLTSKEHNPKQLILLFEWTFTPVDVTDAAAAITLTNPAWTGAITVNGGSTGAQLLTDYEAIIEPWLESNSGIVYSSEF